MLNTCTWSEPTNSGRSSKFREGSLVRLTPEEGRRTYWPKRCGNNNKNKKLATIVEGDPKAPFSIATTPRCRGGRYSFPGKNKDEDNSPKTLNDKNQQASSQKF